jgi:hypothetical protein
MIRTLSCHCGKIRLETNAELGVVVDCNCSRCARAGMLNWHVDRRKVRLATPRSGLSTYVWRFVDEGLHFCPTCGTAMCKTGPDDYFVLNASCIDGIDPHTLRVKRYEGLADMPGGDVPPLAEDG